VTSPRALGPKSSSGPPPKPRLLARRRLPYDAALLARFLIGTTLVRETPHGRAIVRIVETEAYVPGDAASHAFRGETARNRTLFGPRGFAYVYFIYGNYYCLNVSAERAGIGAGVLIRAAEPIWGIESMRARRVGAGDVDLLRGPGRLAIALDIDRTLDGVDLCARGPLWLAAPLGVPAKVATSRRIGLTKEVARPLRFYEAGSRYVSGPRNLSNMGAAKPGGTLR
jgi:DNA-3-methyladenine glycosylase